MNWENWFHLKIFHHCEKWPCPSRFIWSTIGISKTWVIWLNKNKKFVIEVGNSGVITKITYRRDKQWSYLNQLVLTQPNPSFHFILLPLASSLSVQFSPLVVSHSLQPHGPQHTRPPCPSPTPGVYSNSSLLKQWCHPTISSCVFPFSSCPQSFPASGFFQMSQLFASGGQSFRVSASTSVLPMNIQDWSPLGWTGWISFQSKGPSRVISNTSSKASILRHSAFFIVQLSHVYMTTGKP